VLLCGPQKRVTFLFFGRFPTRAEFNLILFFRLNKLSLNQCIIQLLFMLGKCFFWGREIRHIRQMTQAKKKVSNLRALASFVGSINYAILEVYGNLTPHCFHLSLRPISNGMVKIYVIYSN
jgi:hypothetical protein